MSTEFNANKIVCRYIKENRVNKSAVARAMDIHVNTLDNHLLTDAMKVNFITELSALLRHNFFADIAHEMPKEFPGAIETEKDKTIAELREEIKLLERDKETLQKLIRSKMKIA